MVDERYIGTRSDYRVHHDEGENTAQNQREAKGAKQLDGLPQAILPICPRRHAHLILWLFL